MSPAPVVRRTVVVDGIRTSYLEAGAGPPVLLLHGGEFGGGAEICFERIIPELAEHHRVLAPDLLGFGDTDKVVDLLDGRARRVRHLARFCDVLDVWEVAVVGNSMGGMLALYDAASGRPQLPASRIVSIAGGGQLTTSKHTDALFDFDGSLQGMRRIVAALFAGPRWPADDDYVRRRHQLSIAPGAWEAVAAARFTRPHDGESDSIPAARTKIDYARITVPTLLVAGAADKIKPSGWATKLTEQIPSSRSVEIPDSGHCPQIEEPVATSVAVLTFLTS